MKRNKKRRNNLLFGQLLDLKIAVGLFILEIAVGMAGFRILESFDWLESFYMVIITISTVGYGELKPLSDPGRLFASVLIIVNFAIFAYTLSTFTYYVIQGEIFKKMYIDSINKRISELRDHVVLCGFGRYGMEVTEHLFNNELSFVVIERDPNVIETIKKNSNDILFIEGDSTDDDILERAGISRARALITALHDDTENLYTVLTARQFNQNICIISRAQHVRAQKKLLMAGASHVIMPEQIGGFYMATLVTKPDAVEFFTHFTREFDNNIAFEEVDYDRMPGEMKNKSIRELGIRKKTGINIVGFKSAKGKYIVNPSPETMLGPGSSIIILGDDKQLAKMHDLLSSSSEA